MAEEDPEDIPDEPTDALVTEAYATAFANLLSGTVAEGHSKKTITEYSERIDEFRKIVYRDTPYNHSVIIDFRHISVLDRVVAASSTAEFKLEQTLAYQIKVYPRRTIKELDEILESVILKRKSGEEILAHKPFHIRFKNISPTQNGMSEIRSQNMERMVEVSGMVVQSIQTVPLLIRGHYYCGHCHSEYDIAQPYPSQTIAPPYCNHEECRDQKHKLSLDMEQSIFVDLQELFIEEDPENLKEGRIPRSIVAYATNDVADVANPGNTVRVTGILKGAPKYSLTKDSYQPAILDNHLIVSYIEVNSKEKEGLSKTKYKPEDFETFAKDGRKLAGITDKIPPFDWMCRVVGSGLKGMEMEKRGILLMLASGCTRWNKDRTKRKRGQINVLFFGDPATGKTSLAKSIQSLVPNYQFSSGKGMSAAGLTAAAMKNKEGRYELVAGKIVMADRGVAVLDEFDKIKWEDMGVLYEQMESQTVTIDKAGFHRKLNARCDMLAIANPKTGRWNWKTNFAGNITIPAPIISRFDMIFLVLDVDKRLPTEEQRRRDDTKSRYMFELPSEEEKEKSLVGEDDVIFLREYIQYCKSRFNDDHPITIPRDVNEYLHKFYMDTREPAIGIDRDPPIPIDSRYIESLDRLTTATAKLHLHANATIDDAKIATELLKYSLSQLAVGEDGTVGTPDVGMIDTGMHADDRKMERSQLELLYDELQKPECREGVPIADFKQLLIMNNLYKKSARRKPDKSVEDELRKLGGKTQMVDGDRIKLSHEGYGFIGKSGSAKRSFVKDDTKGSSDKKLEVSDSISDDELGDFERDFTK